MSTSHHRQADQVRREVLSFGNNMNRSIAVKKPVKSGYSSIKREAGRVRHGRTSKSCSRSSDVLGV